LAVLQLARLVARYVAVALAVIALNFALPRFLPGDPLDQDPSDGSAAATAVLSPQHRTALRASYHLDEPLGAQFGIYLSELLGGDLGWSISRGQAVSNLIGERLPWTLGMVAVALSVATLAGIGLGVLAAWRPGRLDRGITYASTAVAALPELLVAQVLLLLLSIGAGWFPLQGGRTPFLPAGLGLGGASLDVAWHLTLPTLTLTLAGMAGFTLLSRGAVIAVRAEGYVMSARSKGLEERSVALRHALPNAMLPIVTLFGIRLGQMVGATVVVERIFAVPGIGLLGYEALRARDYPVLQGVFLVLCLTVLGANFATELVYRAWEPRRAG
jgi:peptide/nickel transport system permease protein